MVEHSWSITEQLTHSFTPQIWLYLGGFMRTIHDHYDKFLFYYIKNIKQAKLRLSDNSNERHVFGLWMKVKHLTGDTRVTKRNTYLTSSSLLKVSFSKPSSLSLRDLILIPCIRVSTPSSETQAAEDNWVLWFASLFKVNAAVKTLRANTSLHFTAISYLNRLRCSFEKRRDQVSGCWISRYQRGSPCPLKTYLGDFHCMFMCVDSSKFWKIQSKGGKMRWQSQQTKSQYCIISFFAHITCCILITNLLLFHFLQKSLETSLSNTLKLWLLALLF